MTIDADFIILALTVVGLAGLAFIASAPSAPSTTRKSPARKARLLASPPAETARPVARAALAPVVAPPNSADASLSPARQIERLTSLVMEQAERTDLAERLHRSAGQQLDLASYAVQNLLDELASVVPTFARTASVAHGAASHQAASPQFALAA